MAKKAVTIKRDQEIETREQLEAALRQVGELDASLSIIEAECNKEISEVRAKHEARHVLKPGKQPLTIEALRDELKIKIESYCWANRDELLEGGKVKFSQLTHGKVGWRKKTDVFDDSAAKQEGSTSFDLLAKLTASVLTYVSNVASLFIGKPIASFVQVKITWDNKAIKEAIAKKTIDADAAKSAGFVIVEGMDEFYCEPKAEA